MQDKEVEDIIKQRFDKCCGIFPEEIRIADFRVRTILNFLGELKDKKVLDLGCGKGRLAKILIGKGASVTGVDLSEKLLEVASRNVIGANFIVGSATELPLADDSFDFIICVEVLEHVPNYKKAVEEMMRVLKKNGKIIIIDKNIASVHRRYFLPYVIIKKCLEIFGRWFYPNNFGFKEKWFFVWEITNILKSHCQKTEREYLGGHNGKAFTSLLFLNLFIAWKGIK